MTEPRGPATEDHQILAVVKRAYHVAANQDNSTLSFERARKLRYYKSEPTGKLKQVRPNESAYVTDDVRQIVETILPEIVKIFLSGDEVVKYEPVGPEDVEYSEEATEYINWWISRPRNQGYLALTNWFKDALINGVAWLKHWAREDVKINTITREGATLEDLTALLSQNKPNESFEIIEQRERIEMVDTLIPAASGQYVPAQIPTPVYDVSIRHVCKRTKIELVPVPMDELLIEQKAKNFEDAQYFAHDTFMGRAELLDMGYAWDVVDQLPEFSVRYEESQEERERHKREDRGYGSGKEPTGFSDWYAQQVKVTDHWIYTDLEGIGHAQWYWVKTAGETVQFLLDAKPASHPRDSFSMLMTTPMPHTIWAQTPTDWAVKYQEIRSVIIRQCLDSIYRTNNPRWEMATGDEWETDHTWGDLMSNELGAPVRTKQPGAVRLLETDAIPPSAFGLLNQLDQERFGPATSPRQVGVSGDPNILQRSKTAYGDDLQDQKDQSPIDLIAMNYANISGMTNLFRALLKLHHNHPDKQQMRRVNGDFIQVDPTRWNPEMDAVAEVGPGTGNRRRYAMEMDAMGNVMKEMHAGGYPIGQEEWANWFKDRFRYVTKNSERYVKPPEMLPPPPPPQPDPAMVLADAKQKEQENARLKIEYDAQDDRANQVLDSYKIAVDEEKNQIELMKLREDGRQADIDARTKLILGYADEETERRGQDMKAATVPGPMRVQ